MELVSHFKQKMRPVLWSTPIRCRWMLRRLGLMLLNLSVWLGMAISSVLFDIESQSSHSYWYLLSYNILSFSSPLLLGCCSLSLILMIGPKVWINQMILVQIIKCCKTSQAIISPASASNCHLSDPLYTLKTQCVVQLRRLFYVINLCFIRLASFYDVNVCLTKSKLFTLSR